MRIYACGRTHVCLVWCTATKAIKWAEPCVHACAVCMWVCSISVSATKAIKMAEACVFRAMCVFMCALDCCADKDYKHHPTAGGQVHPH